LESKLISSFQQVPATLYVATLTGFITAIVTLTGVFITNQANNERLRLQLKHEQNEKQKELTRSKLEELYILFKQWNSSISTSYLTRTSVMAGELDYKSALEMDKDRGEKSTVDFSRLEMLIDLYFPSLKPGYMKVDEARGIASKIMLAHQNQCLLGDVDGKKFLAPFLNAQDNFDKETDKFIRLIAEQAERILDA
jgi:hypothetical protein